MPRITRLLVCYCAIIFFPYTAMAAPAETPIPNLPANGTVTISGVVDNVGNEHSFMLRNDSGVIEVKVKTGEPVVLKNNDSVTVTGTVEKPLWGLFGNYIVATSVQVHKGLATTLSDAVTKTTGISLDKGETVQIGKLPAQGMVHLTGTIDALEDPKNFTLKDPTGTIGVSIQSDENVVLAKGAEVSVTGYVNSDALGKKIRATHVIIMSDTGRMNIPAN